MPDARGSTIARASRSLGVFLEMIKFSHSIFALPFAFAGAVLAAGGLPEPLLILKIVIACVFARTAAMSFNRWADRDVDGRNPRTRARAIPAGLLHHRTVLAASVLGAALFSLTAWWINTLALTLSPIALAVLLGYSYTKRFTLISHLVLGVALGLSPVGAWVAVRAEISLVSVLLGAAVLFWTAGFDVIYACQDNDFDREQGLHSIPSRLGLRRALWLSRTFHVLAVGLLAATGSIAGLGSIYFSGVAVVAAILLYEQSLVRHDDLSRVDLAFFTLNGCVSIAFMTTTVAEVVLSST